VKATRARAPKPWLPLAVVALALGFGLAILVLLIRAEPAEIDHAPTWAELAPPAEQQMHAWRWLVIHHSATKDGDVARFDASQRRDRGWEGIGYHFVVGNGHPMAVGGIEATWRWWRQYHGAHAGSGAQQHPYNLDGLGICIVGDYEHDHLDPQVEAQTAKLCALLIRHIPSLGGVDAIIGHHDVPGKQTLCPGRNVDIARLRKLVDDELARPEATP
jgi:N-acetyl-anhydromuramyl-L-alanine amidase AmpD